MEGKTKKDWRFWIFLGLSILWSIRIFWLLIEDQYFSGFSGSMPLNEVGDFLAGSFSPLAFAWLAYGYWMQNRELKNQIIEFKENTQISEIALSLQKKQWDKKDKIDFNRYQPVFECKTINAYEDESDIFIDIEIKNLGEVARYLIFGENPVIDHKETILKNLDLSKHKTIEVGNLEKNQQKKLTFTFKKSDCLIVKNEEEDDEMILLAVGVPLSFEDINRFRRYGSIFIHSFRSGQNDYENYSYIGAEKYDESGNLVVR